MTRRVYVLGALRLARIRRAFYADMAPISLPSRVSYSFLLMAWIAASGLSYHFDAAVLLAMRRRIFVSDLTQDGL